PVTILTYAVDWELSAGASSWFHFVNAVLHGIVCVLVVLVFERWLPAVGAVAAGLVFAVHPVHVEVVAIVASRAALLVATALPAILRAARLLVWPLDLSADYTPQVIPAPGAFGAAALVGVIVVLGVLMLALRTRRGAPALCFAAAVAALAYLPTSNLLFASG